MPAKSQWLLRVPEIIEEIRALDVPVLDRVIVERLFGVKCRRAVQLMHFFGGFRSGRSVLVDRQWLLSRLEELQAGAEFTFEVRRKQRLVESLEEVRRCHAASKVAIPVSRGAWNRAVEDLPEGVCLQPGKLQVSFQRTEDLLGKLFEVAQAAANDLERFRTVAEPLD